MIGQGMHGFVGNDGTHFDDLDHELSHPTDLRILPLPKLWKKAIRLTAFTI